MYLIDTTLLAKLVISAIVGALIGLTRKNKPAGARTFALISLGSTIFTIISTLPFAGSDPTRIISQVVTGIGFLGLGVIWRQGAGGKPSGLTTAAGVWLTAAIGTLVGIEYWAEAGVSTVLALVILYSKEPAKKGSDKIKKTIGNLRGIGHI
ncbi:MgtC/SapB family protein [Candidatus Micrarchaeota archaeon]|nr:MgtC/SapB family protein [Candidatus Micrarchaeota archaeon]